jgi:hypothetical protein
MNIPDGTWRPGRCQRQSLDLCFCLRGHLHRPHEVGECT